MATICNMGRNWCYHFFVPYQPAHKNIWFLQKDQKLPAADLFLQRGFLKADEDCQHDKVIEINLSELEPSVNGPFTPSISNPNIQVFSNS